jgi:lysozyme
MPVDLAQALASVNKKKQGLLASGVPQPAPVRPGINLIEMAQANRERAAAIAEVNYFNSNVGPKELGESDRKRLYSPATENTAAQYQVYQVGEEKRPTVGQGVYLDDAALAYLGLSEVPEEGIRLDAAKVDALSLKRWSQAVKDAREILGEGGKKSVGALSEMIYQMGKPRVNKFVNTIGHMKSGDVSKARVEAADSKWFKDDTPTRAKDVISRIGKSDL